MPACTKLRRDSLRAEAIAKTPWIADQSVGADTNGVIGGPEVAPLPQRTPSPRVRGEGRMRTPHHLARGILRGGNPAKGCVGVVP
jgi:hypothetical protein